MNNKGQSLVLFVILIPIIFMVLWMVYDIGSMAVLKNELDDINYMAIDYGLNHLDDTSITTKVEELINKNKPDINIVVNLVDDKIYIVLSGHINNKLSLFNKGNAFLVKSSYVGYMEDDKGIIKKNR